MSASVPEQEVDISIKKKKTYHNSRKKKYINLKLDKFELPQQCQKHHTERFNCVSLTQEDVVAFRNKIYTTVEKITQDKFVSNYVIGKEPQRRRKIVGDEVIRHHEVQLFYSLERMNGKRVNVCKSMFVETTGFNKERVVNIVKQIKRFGVVKEKRGGDRRSSDFAEKRIIKLVQKTEKEQIKERSKRNFNDSDSDYFLDGGDSIIEERCMEEDEVVDDFSHQDLQTPVIETIKLEPIEMPLSMQRNHFEEVKLEIFDYNMSELCRICLKEAEEHEKHTYLFDKYLEDESETIAIVVQNCLGIQLNSDISLPQYICRGCLERVISSRKLKTDSIATEKYLENYLSRKSGQTSSILEVKQEPQDEYMENNDGSDIECESDKSEESKTFEEVNLEPKEKLPARCYLCDKEFEATPKTHFELNHSQMGKFSCKFDKCEFEIENSLWHLNLHYQVHAENVKLCNFCGKVFTPRSFTSHRGYCGREEEERKKFKCKFCPKIYFRSHILKLHERIHTNEKPYKCDQCSVAYAKRHSLRKHLLSHGAKPEFTCSHCGKGFIQMYRLKGHQQSCFRNKT